MNTIPAYQLVQELVHPQNDIVLGSYASDLF